MIYHREIICIHLFIIKIKVESDKLIDISSYNQNIKNPNQLAYFIPVYVPTYLIRYHIKFHSKIFCRSPINLFRYIGLGCLFVIFDFRSWILMTFGRGDCTGGSRTRVKLKAFNHPIPIKKTVSVFTIFFNQKLYKKLILNIVSFCSLVFQI